MLRPPGPESRSNALARRALSVVAGDRQSQIDVTAQLRGDCETQTRHVGGPWWLVAIVAHKGDAMARDADAS